MTGRSRPLGQAVLALFGPLVWAAHFMIVYGAESLLCRSSATYAHTVLLAAVTVVAGLAICIHGARQRRTRQAEGVRSFLARAALALDGLSLLAIGLVFVAGIALPACR